MLDLGRDLAGISALFPSRDSPESHSRCTRCHHNDETFAADSWRSGMSPGPAARASKRKQLDDGVSNC